MALHVGRTVPPKDVGEPEHGSGLSLQIDHEAVEGLLEALGARMGDVHVELGGAHELWPSTCWIVRSETPASSRWVA